VSRYGPVEPLSLEHETGDFDCGSEAQTSWLQRHALQAHRSDSSRVYVCLAGTRRVAGFYALAAGSIAHESSPPRIAKGLGRYPVPVVILTRLGVDLAEQGRGLGSALVRDALLQVASIADRVGARALLIHAETPAAVGFYQRLEPRIEVSPTDPLDLILLLKDLRDALREARVLLERESPG
jgi:GNAT superfamily N-acetyltransferase